MKQQSDFFKSKKTAPYNKIMDAAQQLIALSGQTGQSSSTSVQRNPDKTIPLQAETQPPYIVTSNEDMTATNMHLLPISEDFEIDSSDWKTPPKKHTAAAANVNSTSQKMDIVPDKNKFASLANMKLQTSLNIKHNSSVTKQLQQRTINDDEEKNSEGASPATSSNKQNETSTVDDKMYSGKFCPPIILKNVDVRKLISEFQENAVEFRYKIVNRGSSCKLYIDDSDAHRELMSMLRNTGVAEAYSFTLREDKTTNVVLRGLSSDYPPEEILNELKNRIPNISNISLFETLRSKQEKIKYNLFLVRLLPGTDASELTKIKYLFHTRVYWEKPKGNRGPLQCRRCQQFGHLAKNCAFAYKCVKCVKQHEPGACTVVRDEGSKAVCVNCGENHPANFRGCKYFKQYDSRRKQLLQEAINKKEKTRNLSLALSNGASIIPGVDFASHFKTHPSNSQVKSGPHGPQQERTTGNILNQFMALSNDLFGYDMRSLLGKIEKFMSNLENFNSLTEKRMAYLDLVNELLFCSK